MPKTLELTCDRENVLYQENTFKTEEKLAKKEKHEWIGETCNLRSLNI